MIAVLLMLIFHDSQAKLFKGISIHASDWTVSSIQPEYKSLSLCRSSCVLADAECKAYSFNETTFECEFGNIESDDLIKLSSGYGKTVYYEDVDGNRPETCE